MNPSSIEDENLSQEILDEGALVPRRISSLHLDNVISSTPFQKKKEYFQRVVSCSMTMKNENNENSSLGICKVKVMEAKKHSSYNRQEFKGLQSDIRNLLRKAIQIRDLYNIDSDQEDEPETREIPHQRNENPDPRELTVADIEKPS